MLNGTTIIPRRADLSLETFPGPGQYEPRTVNRPSSATHKIGTGQRSNFTAAGNTPGPGNYESVSQLKGPKV